MSAPAASTLSIAVEARRRACVLDTALALSPWGLAVAQRLSGELSLYVGRELWELLDNSDDLIARAASLAGAPASSRRIAGLEEAVRQWDVARAEKDLAGLRLYWVGDATGTSLLPPEVEGHVVARFERLARALDARASSDGGACAPAGFDACLRDEVALTVALSPARAFILTLVEGEDAPVPGEPALCAMLRRWEIPCHLVDSAWQQRMARDLFEPIFVRSGVPELIWAGGLRLAAVHVVARRASAIPSFGLVGDLPGDLAISGEELPAEDWWDDAAAFWYPILER